MDMPEAQPSADSLGSRVELFTAPRMNVYVGFVLGTLLTLGGLGMGGCGLAQIPLISNQPNPKAKENAIGRLVAGLIFGGIVAAFGVAGIKFARSLVGSGLEVCEKGFRRWSPGPNSYIVLWSEVSRIEEQYVLNDVPNRLGGPLLSQTYRQFMVVCHDHERFLFDRESLTGLGRLGKRLRTVAEERSIPWVVVGEQD